MMEMSVRSFELSSGDNRVMVEVDPALGESTIKVGSYEAARRLFGNGNGSNGNGGTLPAATEAPPASATQHALRAGSGRTNEWTFTPQQRTKIQKAVQASDPSLTERERRVLEARFLSSDAPTTVALAQELGLRHNSDVSLLTRRALKHLGIKVPRLRARKNAAKGGRKR